MDANNLEFWKILQLYYLESYHTFLCSVPIEIHGLRFRYRWNNDHEFSNAVKDFAVDFLKENPIWSVEFTVLAPSAQLFDFRSPVDVDAPPESEEREIRIRFLEWIISRLETANQ